MRQERIVSTLLPKLDCFYTLDHLGQQPADLGDDYTVRLTLYLPVHPDYRLLIPELYFGSRFTLLGQPLEYTWGNLKLSTLHIFHDSIISKLDDLIYYRFRTEVFFGNDAAKEAIELIESQLEELSNMIKKRNK